MSTPWIEPPNVEVPPALREAVGGHPLVTEVLVRRGYAEPEAARAFLDPGRYEPASPAELPDMDVGIGRLARAIRSHERILVWGDFDVDGQTSTALLVEALEGLGGDVIYHVPVRETESHGVGAGVLAEYIEDGFDVLLTCDTGVASREALELAHARGIDTVVTDHHDLPETMPPAEAVINPKRLEETHPLATLPGVGVAYLFIQELCQRLGQEGKEAVSLDLVALGIVADVAVQVKDARYLLQLGLRQLRVTRRPGLLAIMEEAGTSPPDLTEEDIAFGIGPRLNSIGRLANARLGVELLTTSDLGRARSIAAEVEELNRQRKTMERQVYQAAEEQIRRDPAVLHYAALVLSHPEWPPGVIGIVASRLVEKYHKPTILIASPPDELAGGSARSVDGCDISKAIAEQADLLERYGGHPMAAGMRLRADHIEAFRKAVSRSVYAQLGKAAARPRLAVDGYFELPDLTLELCDDLRRLAPFGPGNAKLTLACRGVAVTERRVIGSTEEHLKLTLSDAEGREAEVVWWRGAGEPMPEGPLDVALELSPNVFRGERRAQLTWVDARPASSAPVRVEQTHVADEVGEASRAEVHIIDRRASEDPHAEIAALAEDGALVWSEGAAQGVEGVTRAELAPCEQLVVATVPPSGRVLKSAIEVSDPDVIYLFAIDPEVDELEAFAGRLAGLVKHVLRRRDGRVPLSALEGAMAHDAAVVKSGLRWLAAQVGVSVWFESAQVRLAPRPGTTEEGPRGQEVTAALAEAGAYRRFYRTAVHEVLLRDPLRAAGHGEEGCAQPFSFTQPGSSAP